MRPNGPSSAYEQQRIDAVNEAMPSQIPWMSPKIAKINAGVERMMVAEDTKSATAAQKSMSSTVPWLNPRVRDIGTRLQKQAERQAAAEYAQRQKDFADQARTSLRVSQLRQRQAAKEYNDAY
jgi:hypothetical protein